MRTAAELLLEVVLGTPTGSAIHVAAIASLEELLGEGGGGGSAAGAAPATPARDAAPHAILRALREQFLLRSLDLVQQDASTLPALCVFQAMFYYRYILNEFC